MGSYVVKHKKIAIYSFLFISLSLMISVLFHIQSHRNSNIELFEKMIQRKAVSYYNILALTRQWFANHNVYIKQNGEKLIKITPDIITKEISQLSNNSETHVFFKVIGTDLSKGTDIDDFDKKSLAFLINNKDEKFFSKMNIEKQEFNLMGSLRVNKSCFSCHTSPTLKEGDILGGLRIIIPAQDFVDHYNNLKKDSTYFAIIVVLGTLFVTFIFIWLVNRFFSHQEEIETNLNEIKELEAANETLLRRYKYALDGSQYGIWDWDLANETIYFDKNWKGLLGYADDEIKNDFSEWEKRVHPDDLENAKLDIENNHTKKTTYYKSVHRMKHKDGSWVWILDRGKTYFDETGKAIRMVGFQADISELKKLEIKFYESEKNLLLAQKISNMGYWKWNLKTKKLTVSDTLCTLLGKESCDINLYDDYTKYIDKEDFERVLLIHSSIQKDKKRRHHYYTLTTETKKLEIEEHLDLINDEFGDEKFLLGTVHDMSNRIAMEEELKEKEELMLHQSKNAAMGEMISMIAHQWRQPITAVSMSANNIIANIELDMYDKDETKTIAQNIAKQTQYLSKTIDDFRNFFMQEKKTEYTTFGKLFDETCSIILASLKNNDVTLDLDFDREITIKTYSREVLQVLLNLLKNAKEAFDGKDVENKTIKVTIDEFDEKIKLKIEDNAGGIPEDKMDKIFEAYFTTKKEQNGTGLGLYMSQTIVKKHLQGEMEVYNNKHGAVFEITLHKSI